MGNICPGSNRRGTSRDINNANNNRSSIMQSLSTSIFRTSNRPQHNTNSVTHNNAKNSNHVINGNNNYNAPLAVPYNAPAAMLYNAPPAVPYNAPPAVPYNAPPAMPAPHVEVVNSRSQLPVLVSEPATVAPPVPIKISEPSNKNVKNNHVDNQGKPQSQSENQNNVNVAQNETPEVKQSRSASAKPKLKGSRKPHHKRTPSAAGLRVESVLNRKTEMMKDVYTVGKKLGQGQFGTTYLVTHKVTGKEFACKSINKRKLIQDDDVEDVKREIQIMHHVCGHPNIISIEGSYEDNLHVHVVMELCTGGELFDRIIKRGHYSEKRAADLARVIVEVVEACHSLGVMHRDLKPENFLFVNEDEDAPLKAIDFGLSIFFKPDQDFNDVVGSPYYVAPEVLRKCYGPEADVWSTGVIIYILLCGVPPFWAETEQGIFEQVLNGKLDFESEPWPKISESAKDLVRRILVRNPKKRLTAHEVLCHPWLQIEGVAPDKPLDSAVLSRLKQFSAINNFKKMALRVIAENLSEEEIAGLKEMFKMIDTDNSGQITFEELKAGLARAGAHLNEPEVKALMEAADIDNSGTIDYAEFVAATMHWNKARRDDYLLTAFEYFDRDRSGYITHDELQKACEDFGIESSQLEDIIQEVDQNNDGQIDYSEFVAMMNKGDIGFSRISSLNQSFTQATRDALKVDHSSSSSTDSDDMEYDKGSTSPHKTTCGTTTTRVELYL